MIDRSGFYEKLAQFRPRESRRCYQQLLRRYYGFLVPPGLKVLELGCGLGDLLAAVRPARGVGIDFSPSMIALARQRHPGIEFQIGDALQFSSNEPFDYILLSDLVNDLPDVQKAFEQLHAAATPRTRLVLNFFSNLWRPILQAAEKLGLKSPTLEQNWLSSNDVANLLHLAGWEVIKVQPRILWPLGTPVLAHFCNRWLAPLLAPLSSASTIERRRAGCGPGDFAEDRTRDQAGAAGIIEIK